MSITGPNNFLDISYEELEDLNLQAKERAQGADNESLAKDYLSYLEKESGIKAVIVAFSDLEGKFHTLDYDKKFLIGSHKNLTFDGSSVRGYSVVNESDLRLDIDWGSFRFLPEDIFGPSKVLVFGQIKDKEGKAFASDMRSRLKEMVEKLSSEKGYTTNVAVELEGFLFRGESAEQNYSSWEGFDFVSIGGYYNALPKDELKEFIDSVADAQRAMGFKNEKDHPEVAPSQFELNYSYTDAVNAADQIQLYKIMARQLAATRGLTASFLPKPVANINGNGMHTNISISKDGTNLFYSEDGEDGLSELGWSCIDKILSNANDLCMIMNPSVNAYRRLDPNFEAPNQIKSSAVDRTSMVRVPLANKNSARIEVRTVSPCANPYMLMFSLLTTMLEGSVSDSLSDENRKTRTKFLPSNIHDSIRHFKSSSYMKELLGEAVHSKYAELKQASMDRCPKELGTIVKTEEILFHHDVCNQYLWSRF